MIPTELQGVLAEMDAQGAAKRAVEGQTSPEEARLAIQGALDLAAPPDSFSAAVERALMQVILHQEVDPNPPLTCGANTEAQLFERTALLCLTYLRGETSKAREMIRPLRHDAAQGGPLAFGAVERRSLLFWLEAIDLLTQEEPDASRLLWRRALDLGSSFGTESHPTILWSYIAAFFPTEDRVTRLPRQGFRSLRQMDPRG